MAGTIMSTIAVNVERFFARCPKLTHYAICFTLSQPERDYRKKIGQKYVQ